MSAMQAIPILCILLVIAIEQRRWIINHSELLRWLSPLNWVWCFSVWLTDSICIEALVEENIRRVESELWASNNPFLATGQTTTEEIRNCPRTTEKPKLVRVDFCERCGTFHRRDLNGCLGLQERIAMAIDIATSDYSTVDYQWRLKWIDVYH